MNIKRLGIAVGGLLLTACTASPTATPTPTTTVPITTARTTTTSSKPAIPANVLGPNGYQEFKLGMSRQAVVAAGGLTENPIDDQCTEFRGPPNLRLLVTKKAGLVVIDPPAGAHTPEGLGAGSTVGGVKAAYPKAEEFRLGFSTPVSERPRTFYVLKTGTDPDKITAISLQSDAAGECPFAYS